MHAALLSTFPINSKKMTSPSGDEIGHAILRVYTKQYSMRRQAMPLVLMNIAEYILDKLEEKACANWLLPWATVRMSRLEVSRVEIAHLAI